MAFSIQQLNTGNTLEDASLSLTLDPVAAIFTETDWVPGDSANSVINVENTSGVDVNYFVSFDWRPVAGGTPQDAQLLAERLEVTVTADPGGTPTVLYTGPLGGLVSQPPAGRALADAADEDVEFAISLPVDAGNIVQGVGIEFDIVFVAVNQ
ncbi:MAG: hypothetical protein GX205_03220 [Firmicutes bacterium]|nr:hypothetical protein [Bacillota bacterium]